ncbi:hypothetical protein [Flaviaesturariibacter aridisoli]|uniref:Uncharacterized protein n=1 Tax=Flaviaesturariibacter aridisoli TaxID=2545761 RepID=A0A4R4DW77_9BACT|nr:hypothetical protein [Flaviaesturariibacter aridisoli]TCZ68325.1 hypothetical protein E0486_14110 [Flaviaesturariibacter aridisoli]
MKRRERAAPKGRLFLFAPIKKDYPCRRAAPGSLSDKREPDRFRPGQKATVHVLRNGKAIDVPLQLRRISVFGKVD